MNTNVNLGRSHSIAKNFQDFADQLQNSLKLSQLQTLVKAQQEEINELRAIVVEADEQKKTHFAQQKEQHLGNTDWQSSLNGRKQLLEKMLAGEVGKIDLLERKLKKWQDKLDSETNSKKLSDLKAKITKNKRDKSKYASKARSLKKSCEFVENFSVELQLENETCEKRFMEGKKEEPRLDGATWLMQLMKAFGSTQDVKPMDFMRMWMSHFVTDVQQFTMDFLEEMCQQHTEAVAAVIELAPQEMATVLDSVGISMTKYEQLESEMAHLMEKKGLSALNPFPRMHKIKKQLRETHRAIPKMLGLSKNKKSVSFRLAAMVEWICHSVAGVENVGNAAVWKLHTDGREIQKGISQVVFSIQPVGLPLFHFSKGGVKSKKDPSKNKQWAKDSSYLVFPFIIYEGKESPEAFSTMIPKDVFSDMIRLEHDGLYFPEAGLFFSIYFQYISRTTLYILSYFQ
jgi:hypothetical protein